MRMKVKKKKERETMGNAMLNKTERERKRNEMWKGCDAKDRG